MHKRCLVIETRITGENLNVKPNPDGPELKIEDSENIPTLFFAAKCT